MILTEQAIKAVRDPVFENKSGFHVKVVFEMDDSVTFSVINNEDVTLYVCVIQDNGTQIASWPEGDLSDVSTLRRLFAQMEYALKIIDAMEAAAA
jgi:hypothetical protein